MNLVRAVELARGARCVRDVVDRAARIADEPTEQHHTGRGVVVLAVVRVDALERLARARDEHERRGDAEAHADRQRLAGVPFAERRRDERGQEARHDHPVVVGTGADRDQTGGSGRAADRELERGRRILRALVARIGRVCMGSGGSTERGSGGDGEDQLRHARLYCRHWSDLSTYRNQRIGWQNPTRSASNYRRLRDTVWILRRRSRVASFSRRSVRSISWTWLC